MEQINFPNRFSEKIKSTNLRSSRLLRLAIIGALGIITSFVAVSASKYPERAAISELRSDVRTLNAAVILYRINGGDLGGLTDPEHVILKLKSHLKLEDVENSTSVIDPRVKISYLLSPRSESNSPRAFWDASSQSFIFANSGQGGIRKFYLEGDESGESPLIYSHSSSSP